MGDYQNYLGTFFNLSSSANDTNPNLLIAELKRIGVATVPFKTQAGGYEWASLTTRQGLRLLRDFQLDLIDTAISNNTKKKKKQSALQASAAASTLTATKAADMKIVAKLLVSAFALLDQNETSELAKEVGWGRGELGTAAQSHQAPFLASADLQACGSSHGDSGRQHWLLLPSRARRPRSRQHEDVQPSPSRNGGP